MSTTLLACFRTKAPAMLVAAGTILALAACAPSTAAPAAADCTIPDAVVLVVAVHANASPGIPAQAACLLTKAMDHRAPISIVAEDGSPYPAMKPRIYNVTPGSDTYTGDLNKARAALITTVATVAAKTDGANTLAALNLAGQLTTGATHPAIVVISPGLSDTAPLDFTVPALASVEPAQVTEKLTALKAIPNLKGVELLWVGNGQASGSQMPLAPAQAKNYENIWASILTASGANTTLIPGPTSGGNKPNNAGHTLRPVPPTPQCALGSSSTQGTTPKECELAFPAAQEPVVENFPNASALGFTPNTTTFRDEAGAAAIATNVATWLTEDTHRTLTIAGTTATAGTTEQQNDLSLARAQAVKELIVGNGIDAGRISVNGLGAHAPGRAIDILADGSLDPIAAETNRTVRITYTP